MFPGFKEIRIQTAKARINLATGGTGPAVLMLHGYPETHVMWHKVAPALARDYTVVCPDTRGYGDSSKPKGLTDHSNYSKRAMARDMAEVMTRLGHREFHLVGHDRGGRVAHRLARDHGKRVRSLAVLDISPTLKVFESTDMALARLPVGHESLAGREHGDAETAEHTRELVGMPVDPKARLRHSLDAGDRARPLGRVLHVDGQRGLRLALVGVGVGNCHLVSGIVSLNFYQLVS